jgi:hypothetical protein
VKPGPPWERNWKLKRPQPETLSSANPKRSEPISDSDRTEHIADESFHFEREQAQSNLNFLTFSSKCVKKYRILNIKPNSLPIKSYLIIYI